MVWDFGGESTIELLDHFLSDIRKADAKLHNAIEVSPKAIQPIAHGIKGSASTYGATRLECEAARLVMLCDASDIIDISPEVERLRAACQATIEVFEQFRQAIAEGSLNLSAENIPLPLALSA